MFVKFAYYFFLTFPYDFFLKPKFCVLNKLSFSIDLVNNLPKSNSSETTYSLMNSTALVEKKLNESTHTLCSYTHSDLENSLNMQKENNLMPVDSLKSATITANSSTLMRYSSSINNNRNIGNQLLLLLDKKYKI